MNYNKMKYLALILLTLAIIFSVAYSKGCNRRQNVSDCQQNVNCSWISWKNLCRKKYCACWSQPFNRNFSDWKPYWLNNAFSYCSSNYKWKNRASRVGLRKWQKCRL